MVRAAAVDDDVARAVEEGRRAVELARACADDVLPAALAAQARALYLAGDLDGAWTAGRRAVEQPEIDRGAPGHAFARATLAHVALDRGRLDAARAEAERSKALVAGVGASRSWLGANASAALGRVLAVDGSLAEAERHLFVAEQLFRDDVPTVQHAWVLLLLAGVRGRRGRLDEAETALGAARDVLADVADAGRVPGLAARVERELEESRARASSGELLDRPSEAELAVLGLLASDLSVREIGAALYLSPNTVRSHTRALYRKLAVGSREDAVARAVALGLLGQA
jgi:LuxR family maltose regulon positive regulatory protein